MTGPGARRHAGTGDEEEAGDLVADVGAMGRRRLEAADPPTETVADPKEAAVPRRGAAEALPVGVVPPGSRPHIGTLPQVELVDAPGEVAGAPGEVAAVEEASVLVGAGVSVGREMAGRHHRGPESRWRARPCWHPACRPSDGTAARHRRDDEALRW